MSALREWHEVLVAKKMPAAKAAGTCLKSPKYQ